MQYFSVEQDENRANQQTARNPLASTSIFSSYDPFAQIHPQWYRLGMLGFVILVMGFTTYTVLSTVFPPPQPHRHHARNAYTYSVVLLGDSILLRSAHSFNLLESIHTSLPEYLLNITVSGKETYTIAEIHDTIQENCLRYNPQLVLLLWDSDIVRNEAAVLMSKPYIGNYISNLTATISTIDSAVSFLAVSGPLLMGEGTIHMDGDLNKQLSKKQYVLDYYRSLNAKAMKTYGKGVYIDLRRTLQNTVPYLWPFSKGYVTVDGEHPNKFGSSIIGKEVAQVFRDWLNSDANTLWE